MRFRPSIFLQLLILTNFSIVALFGYAEIANHPYIDPTGYTFILTLLALLFFAAGRFAEKFPAAQMITLLLFLFVGTRLSTLIFIPESLLGGQFITAEHLNETIWYIILGTISSYLGVAVFSWFARRSLAGVSILPPAPRISAKIVLILFLISMITYQLFEAVEGFAGATGSGAHLGLPRRIFGFLFMPIPFMALALATAMEDRRIKRTRYLIGILAINLVVVTMQAGRSGFLEVIILGVCLYAHYGRGRSFILDRKLAISGSVFALAAIICFPVITQLRTYLWNEHTGWWDALAYSIKDIQNEAYDSTRLISDISYRMSLIEPTFYSMHATEVGLFDISDLVNVENTIKASINRVSHFQPFGDILFSEFAYGFIYNKKGATYESSNAEVNYTGYEWGMFGICFQLFSYYGGLIGICLISGLIAFIAERSRGINWSFLPGGAIAIFTYYTLFLWVKNFGIDNLVDRTTRGFALLMLYGAISKTLTRRKSTADWTDHRQTQFRVIEVDDRKEDTPPKVAA